MNECDSTTARSEVRFSLRGLMLLVTAVAIVAGVLGASLQGVAAEARPAVLSMWGISVAIVVGRVGFCAVKRWRLILMAGRLHFGLAPRGVFGGARSIWMTVMIGILCVSLGLYYMVLLKANLSGPAMKADPAYFGVLPSIISGLLISYGIEFLSWRRCVEFCDDGVLYGIRLLFWSHITKHEWDAKAITVAGVDKGHLDVEIAAVAPADRQAAVKALVERKVRSAAPAWAGLQRVPLDNRNEVATPLVPLNVGKHVTWRGLGSAAVAFVLLGIVCNVLFRPLGAPSREFWYGLFIAAGVVSVKMLYDAWSSRDAGAPLVRLFTRLDWPSAIVAVLITMACYYVSRRLVFPNPMVGYSLGFFAGMAMCTLGGMVMREKFDFCENGVVLIRWPVLPWRRVKVLRWNCKGDGLLLLRSGWRRIKTRVPKEHREFVDRVLREKAGLREAGTEPATPTKAVPQLK